MDKSSIDNAHALNINRLLEAEDVAELLEISRSFTHLLIRSGEIPTVRLGRSVRVRPQDLVDYIKKHTQR